MPASCRVYLARATAPPHAGPWASHRHGHPSMPDPPRTSGGTRRAGPYGMAIEIRTAGQHDDHRRRVDLPAGCRAAAEPATWPDGGPPSMTTEEQPKNNRISNIQRPSATRGCRWSFGFPASQVVGVASGSGAGAPVGAVGAGVETVVSGTAGVGASP